ncbi:MAG: T9SS type A sorting domain-containing protein [Bacteroidetes bacterium]|nr:T9SS type A sorting domain-containing protein [Bacteroidota bacterium]
MKTHIILTSLVLIFTCSESFSQIKFQKTYSGVSPIGLGYFVIPTVDSCYLAAGATTSFGVGNYDALLIKLNSFGDTIWTKTFGTPGNEGFYFIQQTNDLGFIATGFTSSIGNTDVLLVKTDSVGNVQWSKTYGGSVDMEQSYCVQQTFDNGYIIEGVTQSFGVGQDDVYLIKVDSVGNLQWSKTYGGTNYDLRNSVRQTYDGGYILAGQTLSFGAGGDLFLIKTDSVGNLLWSKTYGGPGNEYGSEIQITSDSGYVIVGYTSSFGAGSYDIYLIRTDEVGDTLWTKAYGGIGFESMGSVQQLNDNGYIISGSTDSFGNGLFDFYLIRLDPTGNPHWSKAFGASGDENGTSARQTLEGGFVAAGLTNNSGLLMNNLYLFTTDSLGNSACNQTNVATIVNSTSTQINNPPTVTTSPATLVSTPTLSIKSGTVISTFCTTNIEEFANSNIIDIFPNPSSGIFTINISNFQKTTIELTVLNVLGEIILKTLILSDKHEINLGNFAKGIYFIKATDNKNHYTRKVIVQ